MTPLDEAQKLLKKGQEDEMLLVKTLLDTEISDEVWGFHAQQAVEKYLKSVLAKHSVIFPKTHDLLLLTRLFEKNAISLPCPSSEFDWLIPYATTFRYDDVEDAELDRKQALQLVQIIQAWAQGLMR